MTPKEKAKELVDKFMNLYEGIQLGLAKKHWDKQSALIAVDEILGSHYKLLAGVNQSVYNYWQEVKQEMNKR